MTIRRATADDWQTLKSVRLAALQESPQAFGSTYEKESQWPDDEWRDWARKSELAKEYVLFLAFENADADRCVGMVGGIKGTDEDDSDLAYLIAMWVAPEARRGGVARALAETVLQWASDLGHRKVVLDVTETNDSATALYTSMGFRPTGKKEPLPSHPELDIIEMERTVTNR